MRDTGPIGKSLDASGDTEVAATYIGVARTVLGQLVNQMSLGKLTTGSRNVTLPDGTTIRATVMGGVKRVFISSPATTVEQSTQESPVLTFETPELSTIIPVLDKCLMVIYNGNRIAAIPMGALGGKNWPVIFSGKLHTSVDSFQPVAQFNFGVPGCDSIFIGPFAFEDHKFTLDSDKHWLTAVRQNDGTDGNALHAVQTGASSGADPMLNAAGATIYAPDGIYTVAKAVPLLQQSFMGEFGFASPRGIGADGTYYFAAVSRRPPQTFSPIPPSNLVGPAAQITFGGGSLASIETQVENATQNTHPSGFSLSEFFNGAAAFNSAISHGFIGEGGTSDYAIPFPIIVYQGGGTDQLATASITPVCQDSAFDQGATIVVHAVQSVLGWGETMDWSATQHPSDGSFTFTMSESGMNTVAFADFPPALSASQVYASASDNSGATQTRTPYFTSSDFGSVGWAHLSNGEHVIQAFFTQNADPVDTPHMYFDGADVRAKLEAALKVPLTDVQVMLMDIPLATIQHMK